MTTRAEFEAFAEAGIAAIPAKFRALIENVAVIIEPEPTPAVLRRQRIPTGDLLLGLYEGVPRTARANYTNVLPDKITLYTTHIERYAQDTNASVAKVVSDTIWHEIAHHFGLGESGVRRLERRKKMVERI